MHALNMCCKHVLCTWGCATTGDAIFTWRFVRRGWSYHLSYLAILCRGKPIGSGYFAGSISPRLASVRKTSPSTCRLCLHRVCHSRYHFLIECRHSKSVKSTLAEALGCTHGIEWSLSYSLHEPFHGIPDLPRIDGCVQVHPILFWPQIGLRRMSAANRYQPSSGSFGVATPSWYDDIQDGN
jgi:hypothetical protein